MGIKANFDIDKIFRGIEENLRPLIFQAVTEAFDLACLEVVTQAKSLNTYQDQTNLLRSSIGYQIYSNGELIKDNFETAGTGDGTGANQGIQRGKAMAKQASLNYPDDIVGVIVAGAEYAIYVESKGFDVLSGPASQLQKIATKYLTEAAAGFKEGGTNG